MDLLLTLAQYLATQTLGIPGKDLFVGEMPEHVSGWLLLNQMPINIASHGTRNGEVQVIARAKTKAEVSDMANEAMRLMPGPTVLGGYRIMVLEPKHEPLIYPKTQGGFYEASVNYRIAYTTGA